VAGLGACRRVHTEGAVWRATADGRRPRCASPTTIDAIYVAFECDQAKSAIVALLARRDRAIEADSVSIAFDSRSDGRERVRVLGERRRRSHRRAFASDDSQLSVRKWDEIWEASTQVHDRGLVSGVSHPAPSATLQIQPEQSWGVRGEAVHFGEAGDRRMGLHPARGRRRGLSHYGRLERLARFEAEKTRSSYGPFVLGQARYQTPDPALVRYGWGYRWSGGVDLKWHVTQNVTLDGTINPGFRSGPRPTSSF